MAATRMEPVTSLLNAGILKNDTQKIVHQSMARLKEKLSHRLTRLDTRMRLKQKLDDLQAMRAAIGEHPQLLAAISESH
jgi:hypothetical protein